MDLNNGMLHLKNAQSVIKTSGTLNAIEDVGIKSPTKTFFEDPNKDVSIWSHPLILQWSSRDLIYKIIY